VWAPAVARGPRRAAREPSLRAVCRSSLARQPTAGAICHTHDNTFAGRPVAPHLGLESGVRERPDEIRIAFAVSRGRGPRPPTANARRPAERPEGSSEPPLGTEYEHDLVRALQAGVRTLIARDRRCGGGGAFDLRTHRQSRLAQGCRRFTDRHAPKKKHRTRKRLEREPRTSESTHCPPGNRAPRRAGSVDQETLVQNQGVRLD
jgi:hypothetical protein